jgi:hypothetical protein
MSLKDWAANGWLRPHQPRNTVEYDRAGAASDDEAKELIKFAKDLRGEVLAWLRKNRPDLAPGGK